MPLLSFYHDSYYKNLHNSLIFFIFISSEWVKFDWCLYSMPITRRISRMWARKVEILLCIVVTLLHCSNPVIIAFVVKDMMLEFQLFAWNINVCQLSSARYKFIYSFIPYNKSYDLSIYLWWLIVTLSMVKKLSTASYIS